MEEIVVYERF